jgi:hypothetical protein
MKRIKFDDGLKNIGFEVFQSNREHFDQYFNPKAAAKRSRVSCRENLKITV